VSIQIEVTEAPPRGRTPDYCDSFTIGRASSDARTAEDWHRAAFEGSPAVFRHGLPVAWRTLLGLRMGPRPSPDHVLGWRRVSAEPDLAVYATQGTVAEANLVLRLEPNRAVLTTFVHFTKRRLGESIFVVAGPIHRAIIPFLLDRAGESA
jgi:hypothetical protein